MIYLFIYLFSVRAKTYNNSPNATIYLQLVSLKTKIDNDSLDARTICTMTYSLICN